MKIIKISLALLLSLLWIFATNYKYYPINNLATILTYKSGLMGLSTSDQTLPPVNMGKDLVIKIDSYGIPYVFSDKDENLAYGLGYMHAKDRYFQMEVMSHMVRGELASILGSNVSGSDKFWKPLEVSRKSLEVLEECKTNDPEFYKYLVSYSKGVNAYIENNKNNDPLYILFNLTPKKWKPEYCLLTSWYMSRNLAFFDYHVQRQELLDKIPSELLTALYPQKFDDLKTILPDTEKNTIIRELPGLKNVSFKGRNVSAVEMNTDIGSNNWAINSEKTKDGNPLIVNDPHLFLTLPGAFYEASLIGENIKAYGYTIPGVPLIVSGHNSDVSWGITNGEWDLTDRYLLQTKNDSLYFYQGSWIPFQEKEYSIELRGKGKEEFTTKHTVHGQVIIEDSMYYAQKWYPSEKNYSSKALFKVMQSGTYSEFKNALKHYDYPPQNFIYADVQDTIGIVCAGKLPIRPQGYSGGLLDGTKSPIGEAFVSTQFETQNPEHNYLFSANQLPVQNDLYFGAHWHKDDYRVSRINDLLQEKDDWSVQQFKLMQLDEVDISYFHFKEVIENEQSIRNYDELQNLLFNWDGDMSSDSEIAFKYEILRKCIEEEAKRFANEELGVNGVPSMKSFLDYLSSDMPTDEGFTSRDVMLDHILSKADSVINEENQLDEKEYSHLSDINFYNISFLPGFGYKISDVGGNKNTINMNASAHPIFRSIYEMEKNNINGYTIMAGGQSGKMNSENYTNQIMDWKDGKYKQTQFTDDPEALKNIDNTINFK